MTPNPEIKNQASGPLGSELINSPRTIKRSSQIKICRKKKESQLITKIHDKYYDLTKFKHPGGPIPMALIADRDGTELYESHHLFTSKRIDDILASYEVDDPSAYSINSSDVFDWKSTKEDDFTKELHEAARKVLGRNIKATFTRWLEIAVLLLIALSQGYYFVQGEWFSLVTFPLAFWVFAVNVFHDASHFALSTNPTINAHGMNIGFMFNTPYVWYHQHVIGHHSFPNIQGKDPDLYHAPKLIRHSDDIRLRPSHTYQTVTFFFTWLVGVPLSMLWHGVTQALTKSSYNRVVPFANNENPHLNTKSLRFRLGVYFFLMHISPFLLHGLTIKALLFAIVPIYLFSLYFMICSQINHLTPETDDKEDRTNFFKHQICTSHDVATENYFVFLFTGGLNMQTVHHLFPSVNHCHLRSLLPVVKKICSKYGVKYNESPSLWQALKAHVAHLRKFDHI